VAGEPILRATVRSQHAGWLVSATVPLSHVEAPRRRSFVYAALLLAAALGLGLLLAFMFGRLMTRPLNDATRLAARVGQGETVTGGASPLVEANMLIETLGAASSELARRQEHTIFLMRELAHRAKNQLAVVKGLALQTLRQSSSLEEFRAQFDRRLQGLAQSQDILVRENWQGGWLSDLVHAHLDVFAAGSRLELRGPALFLDSTAVQNIGFALHELATNASKHGALAEPDGRVIVAWSAPANERVRLAWTEQDGPAVAAPLRKGFGHRVIMELVPHALQGEAGIDFAAEGLRWHLEFPASHVLSMERVAS
jgi:two-component sensor histidine kinase